MRIQQNKPDHEKEEKKKRKRKQTTDVPKNVIREDRKGRAPRRTDVRAEEEQIYTSNTCCTDKATRIPFIVLALLSRSLPVVTYCRSGVT